MTLPEVGCHATERSDDQECAATAATVRVFGRVLRLRRDTLHQAGHRSYSATAMLVANATGCSSIYGGNLPTTPWTSMRGARPGLV